MSLSISEHIFALTGYPHINPEKIIKQADLFMPSAGHIKGENNPVIYFVALYLRINPVINMKGNSVGITLKRHILIPDRVPSNTIPQLVIHNMNNIIINIDKIFDFIVDYIN